MGPGNLYFFKRTFWRDWESHFKEGPDLNVEGKLGVLVTRDQCLPVLACVASPRLGEQGPKPRPSLDCEGICSLSTDLLKALQVSSPQVGLRPECPPGAHRRAAAGQAKAARRGCFCSCCPEPPPGAPSGQRTQPQAWCAVMGFSLQLDGASGSGT